MTRTEQALIDQGRVPSYLLSSYSARKLNLESTGHAGGTTNLRLASTGQSFDDLLGMMGTGLLVTEMMGSSINSMTGDYSRGASGFWVENGEIQYPVEEVTVAGNLKDMYQSILAIGEDADTRGSIQTGSILLEHMTVAGQ